LARQTQIKRYCFRMFEKPVNTRAVPGFPPGIVYLHAAGMGYLPPPAVNNAALRGLQMCPKILCRPMWSCEDRAESTYNRSGFQNAFHTDREWLVCAQRMPV
jgi:hypothetical protein